MYKNVIRETLLPQEADSDQLEVVIRPVGETTVVQIRGRLNEAFKPQEVVAAVSGTVVFDLSGIDRVSSFGVRGWLSLLQKLPNNVYFARCSEAMVSQMGMMRTFVRRHSVTSIMVPYDCPSCRSEFNAVYDVITDRQRLLDRDPEIVPCPTCQTPSEMMDDPKAYFAIDDALVQELPEEIVRVLEHIQERQHITPITTELSDDGHTIVRIRKRPARSSRITKTFKDLQGKIILDLLEMPNMDIEVSGWIERAISSLPRLVEKITIVGCPQTLFVGVARNRPQNVSLASVYLEGHCGVSNLRRPVLFDLVADADKLLARKLPSKKLPWAKGPVTYAKRETLLDYVMPTPDFAKARPSQPKRKHASKPKSRSKVPRQKQKRKASVSKTPKASKPAAAPTNKNYTSTIVIVLTVLTLMVTAAVAVLLVYIMVAAP